MISFRVDGVPAPQGSVQGFAVRKGGKPTGRVVITADNKKTQPWRQAILDEYRTACNAWAICNPEGFTGPVSVTLRFWLPRPAAHYGTGRNAHQVRPGAPAYPGVKPDLDKLVRAVLDALTAAGVWRDDAQVAELVTWKNYAGPDHKPGAAIQVWAFNG